MYALLRSKIKSINPQHESLETQKKYSKDKKKKNKNTPKHLPNFPVLFPDKIHPLYSPSFPFSHPHDTPLEAQVPTNAGFKLGTIC
jgi:hypothetical protein